MKDRDDLESDLHQSEQVVNQFHSKLALDLNQRSPALLLIYHFGFLVVILRQLQLSQFQGEECKSKFLPLQKSN